MPLNSMNAPRSRLHALRQLSKLAGVAQPAASATRSGSTPAQCLRALYSPPGQPNTKEASGVLSTLRKLRPSKDAGAGLLYTKQGVAGGLAGPSLAPTGSTTHPVAAPTGGSQGVGTTRKGMLWKAGHVLGLDKQVAQLVVSGVGPMGSVLDDRTQLFDLTQVKAAALLASALQAPSKPPIGRSAGAPAAAVQPPTAAAPPTVPQAQQQLNAFLPGLPSVLAASTTQATGTRPPGRPSANQTPIQSFGGISASGNVNGNASLGVSNSNV